MLNRIRYDTQAAAMVGESSLEGNFDHAQQTDCALELSELGRNYGGRPVLDSVSLRLMRNQTLVVFGPNGAGKTTLLRILATLLKSHRGSARVFDRDLATDGWLLRPKIGLVGHESMLYRDLTPWQNLRYVAGLYGVPTDRIDELLARVGLTARAAHPLFTLSRGMVQRTAICRAVLHQPQLLLLDEPFEGLDPGALAAVSPLIGRESGLTRVLVSHEPARGLQEADYVLALAGGKQLFFAPTAAVDARQLQDLY